MTLMEGNEDSAEVAAAVVPPSSTSSPPPPEQYRRGGAVDDNDVDDDITEVTDELGVDGTETAAITAFYGMSLEERRQRLRDRQYGAQLRRQEELEQTNNKWWFAICGGLVLLTILVVVVPAFVLSSKDDNGSPDGGKTTSTDQTNTRMANIEGVVQYLIDNQISTMDSFHDETTSQFQAAEWLAEKDLANLEIPDKDVNWVSGYRYMFRYVMALNYFATNGSGWKDRINFLSIHDICLWHDYDAKQGVFCVENDQPVPRLLELNSNNLIGTLPSENGKLNSLASFSVQGNSISGTIPSELCNIGTLLSLGLGPNKLQGTIPSCLGHMGMFEFIIHGNDLHGTIPDSLCHADIEDLYLGHAGLSGELPSCLGSHQNLKTLYAQNNRLKGEIPTSLANANNLTLLFLDDNELSGNPMAVLNQLTNLEKLSMNNNNFVGALDLEFLANHDLLINADFSNNNFTSLLDDEEAVPVHLFGLSSMEVLDFAYNQLQGSLPNDIPENDKLWFLGLSSNRLSGSLPSSLANLGALTHLDVSHNRLTGPMTPELGEMRDLRNLFLSENPFTPGPIPETFVNLTQLQEFSVRNTQRTGYLPEFIVTPMFGLDLLDLGFNAFSGTIPDKYGDLFLLDYLLLNGNENITGPIPQSFSQMKRLRGAFLDGTRVVGDLDHMCKLPLFQTPTVKTVLVADCGEPNPEITCSCDSCVCCPANVDGGCSRPLLGNLEADWENEFQRQRNEFVFGNLTEIITTDLADIP